MIFVFFFFQAEDGIRDYKVTGVQTCALPISREFDARRFRCTTLLKPADYQILLVEAPAVTREELKPALRWRIKDMLEYPVEDATIDVLDVPVPPNTAQRAHYMYAVAARNETIRS